MTTLDSAISSEKYVLAKILDPTIKKKAKSQPKIRSLIEDTSF